MSGNRLLPLQSSVDRGEGSRVVGIREDAADDVFEALSSRTAREILAALYEEPDTASSVADEVGTSLQNATYHLEKLVDADLVEVADTWYSEQGREMKVYAPATESLVVFASEEAAGPSLKERLLNVLGAVGVLGVASLIVQRLFGGQEDPTPGYELSGDGGAAPATTADGGGIGIMNEGTETPEATRAAATETVETTSNATTTVADGALQTAQGLPPGLLFFAGGLLVLAILIGYAWYTGP